MTEPRGPLAGLRVLDLTRLLPGPVATMHLADLGAEVIKIEDTGAGDYARTMGPGERKADGNNATGDSLFFRMVNRNKKSLRLDLKKAAGVEVFMRLAKDADVVFESFRPGVVDKLGIGYETVKAINPRVVYCAITGYGQTGPWAELAGHDINYLATAGLLDQIGTHDGKASGPPAIPNLQIGDLLGGALTPLLGVLAAVIGAKVSGQGSHVDVAMTDAVLAHTIFPLVTTQVFGQPAPRGADLLTGGVPCYGVYRTADDRYLAVGALEPKFWQAMCVAIGRPDLASFGLATGAEGRRVKAELAGLIASQPLAHWQPIFAAADCCVTPILRVDEAIAHPQVVAREMVVEVGGAKQYAPPFKLSAWPWADASPAPAAGADSDAVLKAAGYVESDIARLRAAGVI
ncbi:CaiB/BaiF CoA transferase family protein [Sulfuritalea hydrogenivorans]|uniref:Acyl-CoA transferase n=1 Tax=Sulfuritalea hydrogenivorans sk43H TaxID=1223802 RepID=W0SBP8_9PROT|nr:CaiB/BaiF CoA-transferase family protein [Sulfuritalea hydrogenivorans]BAO28446.1 acyl-CoA transferase [Sulfuritalea hydrogenivorans sk43H]